MDSHGFLKQMDRNEFKTLLKEVFFELQQDLNRFSDDEMMLTIQQAAVFLNLKVSTIYEKTSTRSIPHYKRGKKVMFKKSELIAWIASTKVKTIADYKSEALGRKSHNAC